MGTLVGKLDCEPVTVECVSVASQLKSNVDMWHQWYGHLNGQRIAQKDLVSGVKMPHDKPPRREVCLSGVLLALILMCSGTRQRVASVLMC